MQTLVKVFVGLIILSLSLKSISQNIGSGNAYYEGVKIQGKWISKIDKQNQLVITKNAFIEIYGKDTISRCTYSLSQTSCDNNYYHGSNKLDFLKLSDGRCFEITSVTNTHLAYRHSVSGRLHDFVRAQLSR